MKTHKRQYGLALMLLSASVLSLYPTMTLERPQTGSAVVSIKADGKAYQNQKGKATSTFSSATLTLYGSVLLKASGALELNDLAGSLQIGLSNYTITSGKGEVNKKGSIEINAKTSDAGKKLELKLHGSTQGDSVTFDSKESKLSSLYFLALKGQAIVTMPTTTSTSTTWSEDDHDHHHYGNQTATVTVTQNNTLTETATVTESYTVTVTEPSNQTFTETVTQTITEPATNSTVTLTETVTTTIANTTITVTEPSTNSTLTTT